MSEQSAIERTKTPNTINTLRADLKTLGLGDGDVVLVHSSMSAIGWVCGEQAAVVTALMDTVGTNGTIVMPAHTDNNSDPAQWRHPPVPPEWIETIRQNMPAFDKKTTPSRGMGKIAECFRTYPGTLRSNHPHVSFSANGKLTQQIITQHVLSPFFGMDTPLGRLYKLNAKVLLLGVGYSSCTAFHLAEVLSEKITKVKMGCSMLENQQQVWKWFEDYDYSGDDFVDIGKDYEAAVNIASGKIGCAESRLFSFKSAVDFAKHWIINNR